MDAIYLDQAYFAAVQCAQTVQGSFDAFSRLVSRLQTEDIAVYVPGSGYDLETNSGMQLWQILYERQHEFGLTTADVTNVSWLLERCHRYSNQVSEDFKVHANGVPMTSASYGMAYESNLAEVSGIGLDQRHPHGLYSISSARGRPKPAYFLTDESHAVELYRHFLVNNLDDNNLFERFFGRAFPSLLPAADLDPRNLGVDLAGKSEMIVKHLSYLNDSYISCGEECGWDLPRMQRHASAAGVDLSDESSNTKQDRKKMREREVKWVVDGLEKTIECGMHTKVEPTRGRIHFSVESRGAGRVIVVGLMCEHLSI